MNGMHDGETVVIGGVDAHTDTHEAAALDQRGALLGTETFTTTFAGYAVLLDWLRTFGRVDVVAIASTGAYVAGLVRYLREHDIGVLDRRRRPCDEIVELKGKHDRRRPAVRHGHEAGEVTLGGRRVGLRAGYTLAG